MAINNLVCPKCKNKITFLDFIKTPTPCHFKCKYCKSNLRIKRYSNIMIVGSIIYGILIGIFTSEIKIETFSLKFILILLVSIFLLESFFYFILKYKNVPFLVIDKK